MNEPRQRFALRLWHLCAIGATLSCVGTIGSGAGNGSAGGGDNSGGSGGPMAGGTPGAGGSGAEAVPACVVAPAPLRRLTQWEYQNTLRDLKVLRPDQKPLFVIPDDTSADFAANSEDPVTEDALDQYHNSAYRVTSELASEGRLAAVLGCDPVQLGEDACAHQFIDTFGRRAFRRPLERDEHSALFEGAYRNERARSDFSGGVKLVLEAILQSPQFLYRVEGTQAAGRTGIFQLSGYEIATRLAYFLWTSTPDDALLDAAAANELSRPQGIERQVRRMVMDPRFSTADSRFPSASASFFVQWLGLQNWDDVVKMVGPTLFTPAMKDAARKETFRFIDSVLREGDAQLQTLFSARFSFLSPEIAGIYNVRLPDMGELQRVDLPPDQRAGLLTQMTVLATLASGVETSPIRRGVFVYRHLLCQEIGSPTGAIAAKVKLPDQSATLTARQRFDAITKGPPCNACHDRFNPIGFGFGNYDTLGNYSDKEWVNMNYPADPPIKLPVDAKWHLAGTTFDQDFDGAVGFADRLAVSKDLRDCAAEQYLRFLLGRVIDKTGDDSCAFDSIMRGFEAGGFRIPDLLVAIATSDVFRFVRME